MNPTRVPKIAPSILASDFSRLGEEIRAADTAGADWIHVDVMDGHFVPNITIGPEVVAAARQCTNLPLDVHLMIESPDRYVPHFASAGADIIGVHAEACPHLHRTIQTIRETGARACVVINPATSAHSIENILSDVDQVLVMTVNPGFGGQKFIAAALASVRQIRDWADERNLTLDIEVDGGITVETIGGAAKAGANVFVAGTAIFGQADYRTAIDALRQNATI